VIVWVVSLASPDEANNFRRSSGVMYASRILPLEVACNGVSSPTQLCVATGTRPARLVDVDDEMRPPHGDVDGFAELRGELFAACTGLLGDIQFGRARRWPAAGCRSRGGYFPRSWVCSTSSRSSSAASNRNAVDLCTPMSAATSLTPASPRWGQDLQHADGAVDRLHAPGAFTLARCS